MICIYVHWLSSTFFQAWVRSGANICINGSVWWQSKEKGLLHIEIFSATFSKCFSFWGVVWSGLSWFFCLRSKFQTWTLLLLVSLRKLTLHLCPLQCFLWSYLESLKKQAKTCNLLLSNTVLSCNSIFFSWFIDIRKLLLRHEQWVVQKVSERAQSAHWYLHSQSLGNIFHHIPLNRCLPGHQVGKSFTARRHKWMCRTILEGHGKS